MMPIDQPSSSTQIVRLKTPSTFMLQQITALLYRKSDPSRHLPEGATEHNEEDQCRSITRPNTTAARGCPNMRRFLPAGRAKPRIIGPRPSKNAAPSWA